MSQPTEPAANPYAAPAPEIEVAARPAAQLPVDGEIRRLFDQGKNGAAWFYWIAALSLINTLMILGGADRQFALGLGLTLITDSVLAGFAKQNGGSTALVIAIAFDAIVLALVVGCGWLSQKRMLPVFAIGMVLYLLDGLLCLLLMSFMCIAIHAFALWSMWAGFSAYRQLNALERRMLTAAPPGSP